MSLFGVGNLPGGARGPTNSQVNTKLHGYPVQTSIFGMPISICYGQVRRPGNVICTVDWDAIPVAPSSGKGGGKLGGKGNSGQQYDYKSAIQIGLCQGPIGGIGYVWADKVRYTVNSSSETFTIASTTQQVSNHANYLGDRGVGKPAAYSVSVHDYGSPGSITYSGNQQIPFAQVASSPAPGQYSFNPGTGTYTFNAADVGSTLIINYTWIDPSFSYDGNPLQHLQLTFFAGTTGQAPWSYLTTNHQDLALGYSDLAYVANSLLDLGSSGLISNYGFELIGLKQFGNGIVDCNPADIITDFLTNPKYGANFPAGNLGSLTELSDYCLANNLFISEDVSESRSADSWLQDWLTIANCQAVWSEGLLKFRGYGDKTAVGNGVTFTPTTAPVYDLDSTDFISSTGEESVTVSRTSIKTAYNQVTVEWTNRGNDYNLQTVDEKNDWAISQGTLTPAPVYSLHGITSQFTAQKVANALLNRSVYIRRTFSFKVSAVKYQLLECMDMVTLTKAENGLNLTPVRITAIQELDNLLLQITAEEFPWGTASPTINAKQHIGPFGPGYFDDPGPTHVPQFWEPVAAQTQGQIAHELWIALSGGVDWGGCNVWESADGNSYQKVGVQYGNSAMGQLTADLSDASDPDDTNTLAVDMAESGTRLASFTADQENTLLPVALIDQEVISYRTATLASNFAYNITHMRRGAFVTSIQYHKSGTGFWFFGMGDFVWPYDTTDIGQTRFFKFTSFNLSGQREEDVSNVPAYSYRIKGPRGPYPWNPFKAIPFLFPNDPIDNRPLFSIQQQYFPLVSGGVSPAFLLTGQPSVNQFSTKTVAPKISFVSNSTTGGTIPGGSLVVVGVSGVGSDNKETQMSNLVTVKVPVGTNTNKLNMAIVLADPTDIGIVYVASPDDSHGLIARAAVGTGATTFIVPDIGLQGGPSPDNWKNFVVQVAEEVHAGIWGGPISSIGVGTLQFDGGAWTVNQLAGRIITLLSKFDNSEVPLINVSIVSNTADTLTLVTDISSQVHVGDVIRITSGVTSSTATTVTDTAWVNGGPGQPGTGLAVDAEKGNLYWVIGGTGKRQRLPIASNTADTITLAASLTTPLDSTSIGIIVSAVWVTVLETPTYFIAAPFFTTLLPSTDNMVQKTWIVQVLTEDYFGNLSDPLLSPFREMFQPGKAGSSIGLLDGFFALTISSNQVLVDLINGLNQKVTLNQPTQITINGPINSGAFGGNIQAGTYFSLYVIQDATGNYPTPLFSSNFGADVQALAGTFQGDPNTFTAITFTIHDDGKWHVDSFMTGQPYV